MNVALIHEVFHGARAGDRLRARLREAREAGAELALLPELPLDPWVPATRQVRAEDAEEPDGPRQRTMSGAASDVGIALIGGVIARDADSGRRSNRALCFDARGRLLAAYDKLHLPSEEGFWESDHYEPGTEWPRCIEGLPLSFGLQICSDLNRPSSCQVLGAGGVEAIVAPRATPTGNYERWLTVIRACAITSAAYVLSINRPPEPGVDVGGPSLAVAPDGRVLHESVEPVSVVTLEREAVALARRDYPGYLPYRFDL